MIHEPDLSFTGVRGPLVLEDVLFQARKANRIAPLQVLRADRVLGPDHIRSAALHARRAFAEGRNHADKIEVEFLRYVAGERQIKRALAKMGLRDGDDGVVVAFGDRAADAAPYFCDGLGLRQDDGLLDGDDLAGFGVTADQLAATTPERRRDLVLEAVAAVDLMRK